MENESTTVYQAKERESLTPDRCAEWEVLAAAATPGPLEVIPAATDDRREVGFSLVAPQPHLPRIVARLTSAGDLLPAHEANARLFAVANVAIPALLAEVRRLQILVETMRREAQLSDDGAAEVLDDARSFLLRCFPEMDRLGIAMLYKDAHGRERNVPALAEHVVTRLEAAHAYKDGSQPSPTVAERMEELRRDRDDWKLRAEVVEDAFRAESHPPRTYATISSGDVAPRGLGPAPQRRRPWDRGPGSP